MKVKATNPETGEEFKLEADNITSDFLKLLSDFEMSEEGIKRLIDGLDISADAKSLLFSFSKTTFRVGEYIIKIGRKIIDLVCKIYKDYPSATFGFVLGAIVSALISSIPILGAVLGPLLTPILLALGLILGMFEDIKDNALRRKIAEVQDSFSPLGAS
jgi:hypothetical protein